MSPWIESDKIIMIYDVVVKYIYWRIIIYITFMAARTRGGKNKKIKYNI